MKENKMKKINKVLLGTVVTVVSMHSFAQNNVVVKDQSLVTSFGSSEKMKSQEVKRVAIVGSVTQVGEVSNHPMHNNKLKGFANSLPLLTVMKQITPNGWIVKKSDTEDNKFDSQKSVSWEGGETWLTTLNNIAKNYNVNALVNWDEKTITLSNASTIVVVEQPKVSIFELEGTQAIPQAKVKVTDVVVGASEQSQESQESQAIKEVVSAPVVAVAPTQIAWEITGTKSLKENVEDWAKKAGYRLVWTGEDYEVVSSRVFAGEFDSENGPIKQLSIDYGPDSRAQNPLSFQFYKNKTLVVENLMFEQSGYSQYNKKAN